MLRPAEPSALVLERCPQASPSELGCKGLLLQDPHAHHSRFCSLQQLWASLEVQQEAEPSWPGWGSLLGIPSGRGAAAQGAELCLLLHLAESLSISSFRWCWLCLLRVLTPSSSSPFCYSLFFLPSPFCSPPFLPCL